MTEELRIARVFVDAKIMGMHHKGLPKLAFVGFVVEDTGEHDEQPVHAGESDDAEIQAILFAVERLGARFDELQIVCDHQSIVSEAKKVTVKNPSDWLIKLRSVIHENPSVTLDALQSNLAHKTLTEYVNRISK